MTTHADGRNDDFTITPGSAAEQPAVISLGNINGDGYADFVASVQDTIGGLAELSDFIARSGGGSLVHPAEILGPSFARIYLGTGTAQDVVLSDSNSVRLKLPAPLLQASFFGSQSVFGTPGDYNGDGLTDIAVGVGLVNGAPVRTIQELCDRLDDAGLRLGTAVRLGVDVQNDSGSERRREFVLRVPR